MRKKSATSSRPKPPAKDMMETLNASPWYSVGKILPTSTKPQEDVFESFRPNKQCVDYKISETWAKMQRGDIKINLKQTSATYEELPHELCKLGRKKKLKLFSGGPPQWKFIDEVWMEHVNKTQAKLGAEYKTVTREACVKRTSRRTDDHAILQRMVGPEWFMELSPTQFAAIDQLRKSIYWDIRKQTTVHCEEILATLGLVLRPSKEKIRIALQHCCGCPVEFLLVLYQIIDPKRDSYSLNDRLLLSSVVHLSIMHTLRELHVRIPSPPKEPEEPRMAKKKDKKTKYSSPYLEPLTYQPAPPRFSGIYKNKHRQYPESPYFSYIDRFEQEKRNSTFCFHYSMYRKCKQMPERVKEYNKAKAFYESLPGVKEGMLQLILPSVQMLCPNMLNPREKPAIKPELIAPHLCKVALSEPMICFCDEACQNGTTSEKKKIKRSLCEKSAQDFFNSLCLCDECLEKVKEKNIIRIHGGFTRTPCKCDDPVPVIQGTLPNKVCDCYKEYRNKIVACAARQQMAALEYTFFVGGVAMTKFGPIYNILGTQGKKICFCNEITERKIQLKKCKDIIENNEAKFVNAGISFTKYGPTYNLTAVVARRPCTCILRYREQLQVLEVQNKVRKNPVLFVNHGLVCGKFGPIFYFSCVTDKGAKKPNSEIRAVCSCEIKKAKCFERCMNYVDYKVNETTSTSEESKCVSEGSSSTDTESESEQSSSSSDEDSDTTNVPTCPYCAAVQKSENKKQRCCQPSPKKPPCKKTPSSSETTSTDSTTESTSEVSTSSTSQNKVSPVTNESSDDDDFGRKKPCRCKDELDRFMNSKCPCEECNRIIRQSYATYVMGGTKITASGNQVNVVQGIQQPLCSCMLDHLENIKQIDEYKARVKVRYDLRKQPKKYCISGVKNTPQGPVYIISGIRPPVMCECGKAAREKEEAEACEKQRAKLPNTGRIKYEISGVKAMSRENIYIMSRALKVSPCECEKLLKKFEKSHKPCMDEFKKYLEITEVEKVAIMDDSSDPFATRSVDISYAKAFEHYPVNELANIPTWTQADSCQDMNQMKENTQQESEQPIQEAKTPEVPVEDKEEGTEAAVPLSSDQEKCASGDYVRSGSETESASSSSDNASSSSSDLSDIDSSEYGSCHADNPPDVRPITIPNDETLQESFVSKRFAIFRRMPKCKNTMTKIVKHILKGMAEDGFVLAKLPQVYKLPIFKLWIELRIGTYWSYEDKLACQGTSKYLWKHTDICYKNPIPARMPFTIEKARTMTWKHAKLIRGIAADKSNEYYRKIKQITVDTGREFFATTFPYQFPTCTWRDCAFAYLPSKEEDLFPYKIVKPHETRNIPFNKKLNCYC